MAIKPKGLGMSRHPLYKIKDQLKKDIWPVTVWRIDHADPKMPLHKKGVGDEGDARVQSGTAGYKTTLGASKNQVSIFNPAIVGHLLTLYPPPPGGNIYDPFGGGGARAMTCITQPEAFNYTGVEVRKEEVNAVLKRLGAVEEKKVFGSYRIIHGTSEAVPEVPTGWADMLITCPPYYNMEKYQGGEQDLSMAPTYNDFLAGLNAVVDECYRILKPGALACWIIGLHRDQRGLIPIHHDLARIHFEGFIFKEEVILHMANTGSIQRVGNFAKGQHLLVRTHEYCMIFQREG